MKSQDLILLLKLSSLHKSIEAVMNEHEHKAWPSDWQGWEPLEGRYATAEFDNTSVAEIFSKEDYISSLYTVRSLGESLGMSKTTVNLSLNRCIDIGLAKEQRRTGIPQANTRELYNLIESGVKYFWPARLAEVTRGIATAYAAPILSDKLATAGDFVPVWPDAQGKTKGLSVKPLHQCTTIAVRNDPQMYSYLALIDSIRIGYPRESNLAKELLYSQLVGKKQ